MKNTPIYKLVPNIITICGLCFGISAVRYGLDKKFTIAVALILMAAVMDSLDGRLARTLQCTSIFGMQIDSLSDIVSFGVAPALLAYLWSLEKIKHTGLGWSIILFYITCTALRLARFNAESSQQEDKAQAFFTGVPVPAAAAMIMLPMMISFEEPKFILHPNLMALYMLFVGILMISRIPTFSGKKMEINENYTSFLLIISAIIMIGIVFETWLTLSVLIVCYISSLPISFFVYRKNL